MRGVGDVVDEFVALAKATKRHKDAYDRGLAKMYEVRQRLPARRGRAVTSSGLPGSRNCPRNSFPAPCGIRDAGVTSLSVEAGRQVTVAEVLPVAQAAVLDALDGRLPVTDRPIHRAPAARALTFISPEAPSGPVRDLRSLGSSR